jgi:RNA polymerase sporulation-specific sigma factor
MAVRISVSVGRGLANLSDEEVLSLARAGNRLAVEHLLSRYRPLVEGKSRSFFVSGADHEDVVQEGMIGLFKAIRDYQAERLVRFRVFAEICITRQIISAVKTASRRKHLPLNRYVPLHRPWGEDEALLVDVLPDGASSGPEALLLREGLTDCLDRAAWANLSDLERQVIRFRLEGKSYEQMAAELKCRLKCVDNALQRAKRKLWSQIAQPAE